MFDLYYLTWKFDFFIVLVDPRRVPQNATTHAPLWNTLPSNNFESKISENLTLKINFLLNTLIWIYEILDYPSRGCPTTQEEPRPVVEKVEKIHTIFIVK